MDRTPRNRALSDDRVAVATYPNRERAPIQRARDDDPMIKSGPLPMWFWIVATLLGALVILYASLRIGS